MKSFCMALAAAGALFGSASVAQAANLVSDGDFSNPWGGPSFVDIAAGNPIGPWNVTSGSVDLIGGYWQSPTVGGGSVDMDGDAPGAIDQVLTLGPGSYSLSFYLSGNPDGAPSTKTLDVSVGSANQVFTYTIGANTHSDMMYQLETLPFSTSGTTTLSFTSEDVNSPYGPVVGGVSVSGVAEPATWAMMLLGIGAMGAGLRMSRRTQLQAV
jgi:choice-of-anchor C domain-containing protein